MTILALSRSQGIRLKNTMLAAVGAVFLSFAIIYAFLQGYVALSAAGLVGVSVVFWLVNLSIIGVLISGINERFSDPSLSLIQMYWATTITLIVLAYTSNLDALFYLLILLTMVFGIFRVSVKQFKYLCVYLVFALLCALLYRFLYIKTSKVLLNDLLLWLAFSFCAAVLTSICSSIVILRARLKEKNEELEIALETKGRFLANMSHEIRTPMNGVLGMLEISLLEEMPSGLRKQLSVAQDSAKSLLSIINDILDFSKLEAGKLKIDETEFDLHGLLQSVFESFSTKFNEKNLQASLKIDSSCLRHLKTDQGRLRQILNNLIGNAIKFTPAGSIIVTASTRTLPGDKVRLEISVKDSGIGIPKSKQKGLFDSFTQADVSTTRIYGGTGLGLTIAKELCDLLGGEISVLSEPNIGSEFCFWVLADAVKNIINDDVADEEKNVCNLQGKKILIVEDNFTNQEVVLLAMEALKIDASVANHGGEALDFLTQAAEGKISFDLILMDCQMPVLDGYQTTRIIREDKSFGRYCNIPIIAMTANAMQGDREKCLRAGMNDYLAKPVDFELLQSTLCEWMDNNIPRTNITGRSQAIPQVVGREEMLWDKEELLRALGGKEERVERLLEKFIVNLPVMEKNIMDAEGQKSSESLRHHAHSLKGSAANLRVNRVAKTAAKLEVAANEQDWHACPDLVLALRSEVQKAIDHITDVQNKKRDVLP